MKSDDVDTRWMLKEKKKEQATGFNICLPSLGNKNAHSLFFKSLSKNVCED